MTVYAMCHCLVRASSTTPMLQYGKRALSTSDTAAIIQEARESVLFRGSTVRLKRNSPDNGLQAPGCL